MKKLAFFLSFWLILGLGISQAGFSDTNGNEYEEAINELVKKDIVKGYPAGTFKPNQWITRAEMIKIIILAANLDLVEWHEQCFPDVPQEERFFNFICSAKALGIVKGYDDGTFKPNQKVSLVEGLKMAIEGFKIQTQEKKSDFRYEKYLYFAHQNSIFSQYAYYPEQELTRGMMAHLTAKLLEWQSWSRDYQRKMYSAGCGKDQASSTPDTVLVNGIERHFMTSIGKNYSSSRPAKLIIAFHGRTSSNNGLGYYGIEWASDGNTITVYPAGLPEEGPQRNRRDPWDKVSNLRDYQFFDAIVKEISEQYCIDPWEIYAVGHSLGGWFTSMLGCSRGSQLHGIGIVAGSPMLFPQCTAPVATIIFHNPSDPLASFTWGEQIRDKILKQNQCWPETESYPNTHGMECLRYTKCLPGAAVVFCKYTEGGHMRPSGAAEMMRKFRSEN